MGSLSRHGFRCRGSLVDTEMKEDMKLQAGISMLSALDTA